MPREFPDFVDARKAADGKRAFQGTVPLGWMQRLVPLLAPEAATGETWPVATFSARFGYDEEGEVTVRLAVEAELPLICQRSMLPYRESVRRSTLLTVVESVAAQERLPEQYEPVLADQGRVALVPMVEDELLLAVPQVPRNPEIAEILISTDGRQDAEAESTAENRQRPCAGLAELLDKSGRRA